MSNISYCCKPADMNLCKCGVRCSWNVLSSWFYYPDLIYHWIRINFIKNQRILLWGLCVSLVSLFIAIWEFLDFGQKKNTIIAKAKKKQQKSLLKLKWSTFHSVTCETQWWPLYNVNLLKSYYHFIWLDGGTAGSVAQKHIDDFSILLEMNKVSEIDNTIFLNTFFLR